MNIKRICKFLGATAFALGIMVCSGMMNDNSVYAEADSSISTGETTSRDVSGDEIRRNNYAIYINSSVEKQGFKLTIKSVTATKHKLRVIALIENNNSIQNVEEFHNNIFQMTVKNSDCESNGYISKKVNDKTKEYTFDIENFEGFKDDIQLRFDALLPEYDLNAWVNASVNISKHFNKTESKDIQFSFGDYSFFKVEYDILGTTVYYNENDRDEDSYDNRTWDSESKLVLKIDDKLYGLDEGSSYMDHNNKYVTGEYLTDKINIDDVDKAEKVSIIPIKCNIKNSEKENIFDSRLENEEETAESKNVKYSKELIFVDNTKGIVSKVERNDDNVKLYISSNSKKDSLLMALSLFGYYEFTEGDSKDDDFYGEIGKVIYENPDDKCGYIVEFDNVLKDKRMVVYSDDMAISHNDKFEIGDEVIIKG
ncbi:MAG: hypothetical protein Q4F66_01055 [Clostridium sp.]|nr:hypothetical protein [Clostridium sp.]